MLVGIQRQRSSPRSCEKIWAGAINAGTLGRSRWAPGCVNKGVTA